MTSKLNKRRVLGEHKDEINRRQEIGKKDLQKIKIQFLKESKTTSLRERRALLSPEESSSLAEILSIWPKVMEYMGLSEYEAKVYLCLVYFGGSGARRLSIFADVPRTKVYDILKRLIDLGLVREVPGTPKRFVPTPPSDAFGAVLKVTQNRTIDFMSMVQTLSEIHETMRSESNLREKTVWYLNDDTIIAEKCKEIIQSSTRTLTILTNEDVLAMLFNLAHRILDDLHKNGVEVRLFSPLDPKTNPLARELSYLFEVKRVEVETPVLFIESDGRCFVIAKATHGSGRDAFESAIFSDDPAVLSMISLLLIDKKAEIVKAREIL